MLLNYALIKLRGIPCTWSPYIFLYTRIYMEWLWFRKANVHGNNTAVNVVRQTSCHVAFSWLFSNAGEERENPRFRIIPSYTPTRKKISLTLTFMVINTRETHLLGILFEYKENVNALLQHTRTEAWTPLYHDLSLKKFSLSN